MKRELTDADVLTFALAGCNAHEIATFAGVPDVIGAVRLNHVLRLHNTGRMPNPAPAPQSGGIARAHNPGETP